MIQSAKSGRLFKAVTDDGPCAESVVMLFDQDTDSANRKIVQRSKQENLQKLSKAVELKQRRYANDADGPDERVV